MNGNASEVERLGKAPSPTRLARREAIIEAALTVLAEDGYAAAGVARIAARAGVATGSVAYYFGGKDTLFEEAVRAVYERGGVYMTARIDPGAEAPVVLRQYIETNLAYMADHPTDVLATAELARHHVFDDKPHLNQGEDAVVAVLVVILEQGQRTGHFRDFDPWVTARSIRDSIDGVPRLLRRRRDLNLPAVGRELADLYVAATMAAADVRVTPPATAPGSPDARPGTA